KPRDQLPAPRRQQTSQANPEKAREQDEIREVRQQPHVGRHPPDDRGLEKQHQKRRDEEEHRDRLLLESRAMTKPDTRLVARSAAPLCVACLIVTAAAWQSPAASPPALSPAGQQAIAA